MTPFLVALVVAAVATGVLVPVLTRAGVMDVPNARSSHTRVVPRGGGVGLLAGLLVAVLVDRSAGNAVGLPVVATVLVLAAIGLVDDLRGIPVLPRLVVQLLVSAALAGYLALDTIGGVAALGAAGVGGLWLVSYVNAFNFMDGINGISALSAAVAGGWYAWIGQQVGAPALLGLGLALAGAALGFLPWNAPRARVFLGDVGSYGVGALVGALALLAWLEGAGLARSLAPLVIYLADTAYTLVVRVRRGDRWRDAHREHAYQRLVDAGWSHLSVAAVVAACAGVISLGLARLDSASVVGLGVLVLLGYLVLPGVLLDRPGDRRGRQAV